MYGWAGDGYPVAGVDYDPALLGQAVVFPQEDIWRDEQYAPIPTGGPIIPVPSATQWLNANAGKVALGVGGFMALMLLAKAGR